ncbi:hypothetical protein PPMP20_24160 [Paraburkholderia phymatum]|uniref:Uncharacterized protein n=1 Tax=Paraburkholderia phymatum (strain DSM 17167 / CIP 108236 / LMG 21445 / STM815) TaxID=391038 RepID=B2JR34_PARP8|nr:hypothetical protein [Paraburkholderia phymatum]ACC73725.1 conserved hypothetical protein [Paraburkholderia phymatum STM815]
MTRTEFEERVGTILRDHGTGTTADLTDELVAYWNGHAVAYVLLHETASGANYEDFVMDDAQWTSWRSWLEAWMDSPTFSVRPEVRHWMSEEPPADADS